MPGVRSAISGLAGLCSRYLKDLDILLIAAVRAVSVTTLPSATKGAKELFVPVAKRLDTLTAG